MSTDWRAAYAEMLTGCPSLGEAVGTAIGAASMCWESPAGAGEFDSTRAGLLVDALVERIQAQVQADLDQYRTVITDYVDEVESGEKFGALLDLVFDENGKSREQQQ